MLSAYHNNTITTNFLDHEKYVSAMYLKTIVKGFGDDRFTELSASE